MDDYTVVERAIRFIEANRRSQPELADVAAHVGLSEFHLQRLFARWAGISPKRFLQYLTAESARELLRASRPVLEVAHEVGVSGPGRLHDLAVRVHAMTPGEVARSGAGLDIRYGVHESPFGPCLIAQTARGVCALRFLGDEGADATLAELREEWTGATFSEDRAATVATRDRIFAPDAQRNGEGLSVLVKGTNFQVRVWEALLRVPPGRVTTYGQVADWIGNPRAVRAVGSAVGGNPVAYLIPCHRVIRKSGAVGGYRYGSARKRAMLAWEAARAVEGQVTAAPSG